MDDRFSYAAHILFHLGDLCRFNLHAFLKHKLKVLPNVHITSLSNNPSWIVAFTLYWTAW